MNLEITRGLPRYLERHAAQLYYQSFKTKVDGLLMKPKNQEQAIRIFMDTMNWRSGFYALCDGELVGLAGVHVKARRMINLKAKALVQEFGIAGGLYRALVNKIESPDLKSGELRIEAIAVSPEFRGMGVGTKLLAAVTKYARDQKFHTLCLEVVNTNPRARELYQRLGFRIVKEVNYGILARPGGFTKVWYMKKPLEFVRAGC